jgi:hypothetical protein
MRFLIFAFAMTTVSTFAWAEEAALGISPEIFAACEKQTPTDFKQQLACVKEQVEAFNALSKLKPEPTRQIVVQPKPAAPSDAQPVEEEVALDAPAAAPEPAAKAAAVPAEKIADAEFNPQPYCNAQFDHGNQADAWSACMDSEIDAHKSIKQAIRNVSSDTVGDPYEACRNFTTGFGHPGGTAYLPQRAMLNCLKSKTPTRIFSECYRNFVGKVFRREVQNVPAKHVEQVANCFNENLGHKY